MKFFHQIKSSIYNPTFYKDLEKEKLSYSIKYFLKLLLFFALIFTVLTGIINISFFKETKNLIKNSFDNIPEDLEIRINGENGLIESNKKEVYFLNEEVFINSGGNIKRLDSSHVVAIDTNEDFSLDALNKHNSIISIFKDSIVFYNPENENIRIYQADKLPNLTISKEKADKWKMAFLNFWPLIVVLINAMTFLISFLMGIKYIIWAVFFGFFIFMIYKLKNRDITFKYSFKIALHSVTIAIMFDFIINSFVIYRPNLNGRFFSEILVVLVLFYNLRSQNTENKEINI